MNLESWVRTFGGVVEIVGIITYLFEKDDVYFIMANELLTLANGWGAAFKVIVGWFTGTFTGLLYTIGGETFVGIFDDSTILLIVVETICDGLSDRESCRKTLREVLSCCVGKPVGYGWEIWTGWGAVGGRGNGILADVLYTVWIVVWLYWLIGTLVGRIENGVAGWTLVILGVGGASWVFCIGLIPELSLIIYGFWTFVWTACTLDP